jgi:ectoine hydroxylase-related dioxygenase (phytanoyl-CoA dioxygenase family)
MAKLDLALQSLRTEGYAVLDSVLTESQIEDTKHAMYEIQAHRPERSGELGVLRLMMEEDPYFLYLLEIPRIIEVIDATIGAHAILHTQNGFILPSLKENQKVFQNTIHQDFPRTLNGYLASINVMVALDDFTEESGATILYPRSHQRAMDSVYTTRAHQVGCKAGDALVFDSTLWHHAGHNTSGKDRCAINHQFTKHWIKQQIDYPRALDWLEDGLKERTKQLLGFNSRVPTSLTQFYQVPRIYKAGQG